MPKLFVLQIKLKDRTAVENSRIKDIRNEMYAFDFKNASLVPSRSQSLPHETKPIDWPLCTQAGIFRDWAVRMKNKKALEYFDRSIAVCSNPKKNPCCSAKKHIRHRGCCTFEVSTYQLVPEALHLRSKCLRQLGQPALALADAEKAHELTKGLRMPNGNEMLNKCDALLECNRFEDYLLMLNREMHNYRGDIVRERFQRRANHICRVIYHALGDKLHSFMLHNRNAIMEARSRPKPTAHMAQPQWLQRRDNLNCDVQSSVQSNKEILSPLEQMRRRVNHRQYCHKYLHSNVADLDMLYRLQSELRSSHMPSQELQSAMLAEQIAIVKKFMKMGHSRSPLYLSKYQSGRVRQLMERKQADGLMRIVYQTRRDCHRMLRELHYRRQRDNIDQLTDYVEHVMSNFTVYKTSRTLPWKWEFVNDVYNMLGMAHIDRCTLPKDIQSMDLKNSSKLYRLPADRLKDMTLQFGGRNIYADSDKENGRQAAAAKKLEHLRARLTHSRYAIERTYLLFEMGRCQLKGSHLDITIKMARWALLEARNCNSDVWRFNIIFLMCQVYATLKRYEQLKDALERAKRLAARLGSGKLLAYLELCSAVVQYEMDQRKRDRLYAHAKVAAGKVHSSLTSSLGSIYENWKA